MLLVLALAFVCAGLGMTVGMRGQIKKIDAEMQVPRMAPRQTEFGLINHTRRNEANQRAK